MSDFKDKCWLAGNIWGRLLAPVGLLAILCANGRVAAWLPPQYQAPIAVAFGVAGAVWALVWCAARLEEGG